MGSDTTAVIKICYDGDTVPDAVVYVDKQDVRKCSDKVSFLKMLSDCGVAPDLHPDVKLSRKSKKHRRYIPLECADDFKGLSRSLDVKNHVRLLVEDKPLDGAQSAGRGPAGAKSDPDSSAASTVAAAGLGDALIDAAIEKFKDIVSEFTSELVNSFKESVPDATPEPIRSADVPAPEPEPPIWHTNATCDLCHPNDFAPIKGPRFRCLICPDFDLCSDHEQAFQAQRTETSVHSYKHPTVKIVDPKAYDLLKLKAELFQTPGRHSPAAEPMVVHNNVSCDSCTKDQFIPIEGTRYKCLICDNFDLCEACYTQERALKSVGEEHNFSHPMQRLGTPLMPEENQNYAYIDVPMNNCSDETKSKIISLIEARGMGFLDDIDKLVKNSERYEQLVGALEADLAEDDLKYAVLQSLVSAHNETQRPEPEQTPTNEEVPQLVYDEEKAEIKEQAEEALIVSTLENPVFIGKFLVFTKRHGSRSRIISLRLTNLSDSTFPGGDLTFHFTGGSVDRQIVVKNGSPLHSSQARFYNLQVDPEEDLNNKWLKITSANNSFVVEGQYQESNESISLGIMKAPVPKEVVEASDKGGVLAHLKLKTNYAAQLKIRNWTSESIDCSGVTIEIFNFLRHSVCRVVAHKTHGIDPNGEATFNIPLNNGHIRHPIEVVFTNKNAKYSCRLSNKNLSALFNVQRFESESDAIDRTDVKATGEDMDISRPDISCTETETDHEISTDNETIKEDSIGSTKSMVLPSLPKESLEDSRMSNSEYLDAEPNLDHKDGMAIDSDYDVISIGGEYDDLSDFEVLSPISSNNV